MFNGSAIANDFNNANSLGGFCGLFFSPLQQETEATFL
jgi:hypothetical protein